jgi:hypothetical protein
MQWHVDPAPSEGGRDEKADDEDEEAMGAQEYLLPTNSFTIIAWKT